MKHVSIVSKGTPAKAALLPEDHPSIIDSILGFLANPLEVLLDHIAFIFEKGNA